MKIAKIRINGITLRKVSALWLCFVLLVSQTYAIAPSDVISNPHGAAITKSGNTTSVSVIAPKTVLEWKNFNTTSAETLNFSSAAGGQYAVLNRILSSSATQFNGALNAPNGHIILINTKGIVFGPTALVNAYKFTASGLNLTNDDFLNGRFFFSGGGGTIENKGTIQARDVHLLGGRVINSGVVSANGGLLLLATGNEIRLTEPGGDVDVVLPSTGTPSGSITGDITNVAGGRLENPAGAVVLAAGDMFSMALPDLPAGAVLVNGTVGNINQRGVIRGGDVYLASKNQTRIESTASTTAVDTAGAAGAMAIQGQNIYARSALTADGDMMMTAKNSIAPMSDIYAGGTLTMKAEQGALGLYGDVQAGGDTNLFAKRYILLDKDLTSGGTLTIKTIQDKTFSYGDIWSRSDILLDTSLLLQKGDWDAGLLGWNGDQSIVSQSGRLTALGYIHKTTPGQLFLTAGGEGLSIDLAYSGLWPTVSNMGNIYIRGKQRVQIGGLITGIGEGYFDPTEAPAGYRLPADRGGVSIISEFGDIFTRGFDGLAISVEGFSDDISHRLTGGAAVPSGVVLPQHDGLAAIVIQSYADLNIGASEFRAAGVFVSKSDNSAVGVDDRPAAGLLSSGATIGGYLRDPGEAADVALYFGSQTGDVIFGTSALYFSLKHSELQSRPTVVLDAYDTVSMPFLTNLPADEPFGGFRLEAVSRRTEWLDDAIAGGRLPFADNPAALSALLGDAYVMRGAGLDNPRISDGRAWVLENKPATPPEPPQPEPQPTTVVPPAPLADLEIPKLVGCPVELQAAAAELNISPEQLQLIIHDSLATNPSLQPCQACADLLTAAAILQDSNGEFLSAINEVFYMLAPADAPFSPDVAAALVSAFEQMSTRDRQFAMAADYVDAFVRYVAVISQQLKAPVGDPVAFALAKYGDRLTGQNAHPYVAAYILSQLVEKNAMF